LQTFKKVILDLARFQSLVEVQVFVVTGLWSRGRIARKANQEALNDDWRVVDDGMSLRQARDPPAAMPA
jgi:hypothetical protein